MPDPTRDIQDLTNFITNELKGSNLEGISVEEKIKIISRNYIKDITAAICDLKMAKKDISVDNIKNVLTILTGAICLRHEKQIDQIADFLYEISDNRWTAEDFKSVIAKLADLISRDPTENTIRGALFAKSGNIVDVDGKVPFEHHEALLEEKFREGYEAAQKIQRELKEDFNRLEL